MVVKDVTRRSLLLGLVAIGAGSTLGMTREGRAVATQSSPWGVPSDDQLRQMFRSRVRCGTRRLYVSGVGSDSNSGSAQAPFREIGTAVRAARPGDLILVETGTYGYTEVRDFHGRDGAWLGIMTAHSRVRAVIHVPAPTDDFVNVVGSSYVGLYGFEIVGDQDNPNTNGSGLSVYGNSHHVTVWANHIHDFPGGGVNCFDVGGSHDLVDISYNTIHGTSKWSPSNTSGISIYAPRDLTGGARISDGFGYRIVGNYVYDVECRVPFTAGGFSFVTDGNAISLDLIRDTYGYTKPILVENNILAGCGGRGVHAYGTVNVLARHNTVVGNMRTVSPAITGGAELDGSTDRTVRYVENVICPIHTPQTSDQSSAYHANIILGGAQAVPAGNQDLRSQGLGYFAGPLTRSMTTSGAPRAAFAAA